MDRNGIHRTESRMNGEQLGRLRAQQEAAVRDHDVVRTMLNAEHQASAQQNLARLFEARQQYISQMQNAIVGKPSGLFKSRSMTPTPVFNAFTSNVGSPIHEMGVSNQPAMTPEQKAMSDHLGAQLFRFPDTDPLAYHRRIEKPHVFRASPVFGF
jgi:hypothetical protein